MNVEIKEIPLNEIEHNEGQIPGLPQNPRQITKKKYQQLIQSIQDDPEMLNLKELWVYLHEGKYIVIAGNMRLKALRELKYETAPCKIIPPTTSEKLMKFAIKDNLSFGDYDWDILANEWDREDLEKWGMDTGKWKEMDKEYSHKIGEIIYEPKKTNHSPNDLYKIETKFDKDIEAIHNPELKEMFRARAYNFTFFNFEKLADYYAYQATPEEQRVFEKLALVLLDKDKLIENGFSKLINRIDDKPEDYETE